MNTIFVPTDFSKYAVGAVRLAHSLAEATHSSVTLHYNISTTVDLSRMTFAERAEYPELLAAAHEAELRMDRVLEMLEGPQVAVNRLITYGNTVEQITSMARMSGASMILMGSHGIDEPERVFIGSTIQKVIRAASCPVLTVKPHRQATDFKNIVFPVALDADQHAPLADLVKFAQALDSTIHLLYVNTPDKFIEGNHARSEMQKLTQSFPGQSFEMVVVDKVNLVDGIAEYSQAVDAGVIAMVTHDRLHKAGYLIGFTETLIFRSNIPVLSFNERAYKSVPV